MLDSILNSSWWLTPTCLFLFLNLVIGTIVIITRLSSHRTLDHQQQLGRVPSVIDRVKSFNLSLYRFPSTNSDDDHHFQPPTTEPDYPKLARVSSFFDRVKSVNYKFPSINNVDTEFSARENENRVDTPLARVPSFLDRVKSVDFSLYKSPVNNVDTELVEPAIENRVDTPLARVPSFLDRVKSVDFSLYKSPSNNVDTQLVEPAIENRVDSYDDSTLLDRVKSNISRYLSDSNSRTEPDPDDYSDMGHRVHMRRTKSDHNEIRSPEKMKKSASEKFESWDNEEEDEVEIRRPQTVKVEKTAPFNGDVDVKADDFINKFKQQLKLQRLDSLLRYRGK